MNKFIVASIFLAFFSCEYVSAGIVELQNDNGFGRDQIGRAHV